MREKAVERRGVNKEHNSNFKAGYVPIEEERLHKTGLRGRKGNMAVCIVVLLFLLALINLIITLVIWTVIRIGPNGCDSIEFHESGLLRFKQKADMGIVHPLHKSTVGGRKDQDLVLVGNNNPVVFQQGTTKLSVDKDKTSVVSDLGISFTDPRTQNTFFSTDFENHEFHLPKGVKVLSVKKASTERVSAGGWRLVAGVKEMTPGLEGSESLQVLQLSFNRIASLRPGDLLHLRQLKELHLQHNLISSLHPQTFQDLANLRVTSLTGTRTESSAIVTTVLDLSFNMLTSLHPRTIPTLRSIGADVRLRGNRWRCDCGMLGLRRKMADGDAVLRAWSVACASPSALAGRDLLQVEEDELNCPRADDVPALHRDVTVQRGAEILLSCAPQGSVWRTPGGEASVTQPPAGLLIKDIEESDTGLYVCARKKRSSATNSVRSGEQTQYDNEAFANGEEPEFTGSRRERRVTFSTVDFREDQDVQYYDTVVIGGLEHIDNDAENEEQFEFSDSVRSTSARSSVVCSSFNDSKRISVPTFEKTDDSSSGRSYVSEGEQTLYTVNADQEEVLPRNLKQDANFTQQIHDGGAVRPSVQFNEGDYRAHQEACPITTKRPAPLPPTHSYSSAEAEAKATNQMQKQEEMPRTSIAVPTFDEQKTDDSSSTRSYASEDEARSYASEDEARSYVSEDEARSYASEDEAKSYVSEDGQTQVNSDQAEILERNRKQDANFTQLIHDVLKVKLRQQTTCRSKERFPQQGFQLEYLKQEVMIQTRGGLPLI
ncbi:Beta-sarcoglycan [Liparis tanakae]|uniref:Beta-sarcoglycan n=1 Tax=Liparis tanakae TaxID=230148 RepID=A0A4Z2FQ27_9TELE|nr:Beta-sarcoglycan [Liparis tanakae]